MENQAGKQSVQIEGSNNRVDQDQSVNIQINLTGTVVDQFIVQGGMHFYLQFGQDGRKQA